jgi:hypothetical protein
VLVLIPAKNLDYYQSEKCLPPPALQSLPQQIDYWTEECLIDEISLQPAIIRQIIKHNRSCGVTVYKYYSQAFQLLKWIPIAKPTPDFIVNVFDLNTRIIAELKALDKKGSQYVLKQAVGRIFENIDFRQYHLSIARNLEVTLKP